MLWKAQRELGSDHIIVASIHVLQHLTARLEHHKATNDESLNLAEDLERLRAGCAILGEDVRWKVFFVLPERRGQTTQLPPCWLCSSSGMGRKSPSLSAKPSAAMRSAFASRMAMKG